MSDAGDDIDPDAEGAGDDEASGEGGEGKKPRNKKKLILFAGIGLVALLALGGGGAWFLGVFSSADPEMAAKEQAAAKPAVFFELPDMTVNLTAADQRTQYLRMKIALEVSDKETISQITPLLPRVLDTFQVYLRELRISDLEGSAGVYRLKEELRRRVNLAVYPAEVNDILFKELLIQ